MSFADIPAPPVPALQNVREIGQLWELVASRSHARVLEIGSLYGGTLWYWLHLPLLEELVSIDLVTDYEPMREAVLEARTLWAGWPGTITALHVLEGDSRSRDILAKAAAYVAGPSRWSRSPGYDFVFIDGDHSYEGVRNDWLNYGPLIRPGGIVAFHDTWPNLDRHEPGVVQWIDELRHHLPSTEFTDPDGVGITAFEITGP